MYPNLYPNPYQNNYGRNLTDYARTQTIENTGHGQIHRPMISHTRSNISLIEPQYSDGRGRAPDAYENKDAYDEDESKDGRMEDEEYTDKYGRYSSYDTNTISHQYSVLPKDKDRHIQRGHSRMNNFNAHKIRESVDGAMYDEPIDDDMETAGFIDGSANEYKFQDEFYEETSSDT